MAEITNCTEAGKIKGFGRARKLTTHIDMTPMVDLGFLLITFFIFTTSMKDPVAMMLIMPNEKGAQTPVRESAALTIVPVKEGKFDYYEGSYKPEAVRTAGIKEIRKAIIDKKRQTPDKHFVVLIKPAPTASYKNVVDALDEMVISSVKRYALVDLSKEERDYWN